MGKGKENRLLLLIRNGQQMTLRQQMWLTVQLSIPSIVAQVSAIAMQYIDAAMVGRLGADAAASIGLVSTTTWLFWGMCSAAATGFSVQVAHHVGGGRLAEARSVLRQALVAVVLFSSLLALAGAAISGSLPVWLGGTEEINSHSSAYFLIFALSLPLLQLNFLAGSMLRCSGNMKVPGLLNVLMCLLDVIFNFFLIFPTRQMEILGFPLQMPGAGLGVTGAALGTAAAEAVVAALMLWYLVTRSTDLKLTGERGSFRPTWDIARKALHILSQEQMEIFLAATDRDPVWRDFFYTELTTGLRLGEICGLMWSDFDGRKGTLNVTRTLHREKGGRLVAGDTKTYAGTRKILLPSSTAERLTERKKHSYSQWIFPNPLRPEAPLNPGTAYRQLKKILRETGLPELRFHDLRHTFATHALANGVDAKTLSGILGHTKASFTLDTYTHTTGDMQRRAAEIVGGFLTDYLGEEMAPWQNAENTATAASV